MSKEVITNFKIKSISPIDSRMVISCFTMSEYDYSGDEYNGLSSFNIIDGNYYIYLSPKFTNEYIKPINPTYSYIPKYTSTGNFENSLIKEDGGNILVGDFVTMSNLVFESKFNGNGESITNINANNISTGTFSISLLENDDENGVFLRSGSESPIYDNSDIIVNDGGISFMSNTPVINPQTLTGNSSYLISSVNYDRIIFIKGDIIKSDQTPISISIQINTDIIYRNYFMNNNYKNNFNYFYILPHSLTSTITYQIGGNPYNITIYSYKFKRT